MTSVNELYPRVQKLKYDLQQQLKEVEAKRMPASDMQLGLDALHQQAVQLESLAEKEVNRKAEWAAKLQDIHETHNWLLTRLQRWRQHHDRERVEAAERAELLGDTKLPASVVAALDEEGQSYDRSSRKVGGLMDSAYGAMHELSAQREMLKGTQRRVLDMLTTLGVSRSTIRVIEQRNVVDRAMVWGGMGITTVALYLLWRWVR